MIWYDCGPSSRVLLLLLVLIVIQNCVGKPPCPAETPCFCTDLRLKCLQPQDADYRTTIDKMPYINPPNFETRWSYNFHEFRIRDHALTNLTLRYHFGVVNVKNIEVTHCLVRNIMPNAFSGLTGIESLNLSYNLLTHLNANDLRDLPSLRHLSLHKNQLRVIHPNAFEPAAFISKLYLSENVLNNVPVGIVELKSLTHLYLQFNNISVIRNNSFTGLTKLIILDLSSLRKNLVIEPNAFCGTSVSGSATRIRDRPPLISFSNQGLVAIYLRDNLLKRLDMCALGKIRSLTGLNLTGTYFPCSCQGRSFLDQSNWLSLYGFAPRFVAYESMNLANCIPDCSQHVRPCSDTCPNSDDVPNTVDIPYGSKIMILDDMKRHAISLTSPTFVHLTLIILLSKTLNIC